MLSNEIYKRDSKGQVRTWQFEVDGARWRTISGLQDGQKVTTGWTTCVPASQETAEEQAYFEARAEERKKLDRDYRSTIEDIDRKRASVVKPMLAQKYENVPIFPVYSQPKLDGVRCLATKDGLWSRQAKQIVSCPHVEKALAPYFEADPSLIFDGELYHHDLRDDLPTISGLVRKQKLTEEEFAETAKLEYHIYDLPSCQQPFWDRFQELRRVLEGETARWPQGTISLVMTYGCGQQGDLDALYSSFLEQGYEGQMVRLNGPYEEKRSKQLLKRKEFQDGEFKVLRIEEGNGNWAGYAKRAVLQLDDGREFGAGIKGNQDAMRALLAGPVPKEATIRFFKHTPDGIPFLPVAVEFHPEGRAM